MDVLGWLRRPAVAASGQTPGPDSDFWYEEAAASTGAGIRVTPAVALKSQAVFACVSKIAKIMATMPLKMYREDANGQVLAADHYLDDIIHYQPNMNDTAADFWQLMMWHAILRGTAYAEIISTQRKPVAALVPIHPDLVRPEKLSSGKWRFKVRDPETGTERTLLQSEIFRFAGLVTGGVQGMGLCEHADEAIALARAADQYASRVFSNSLNAGIILSHPNKLSEGAQDNLVKALMRRLSGSHNAHRPLVLQEGMTAAKGFTQTADEAQLLEARKWQVLEVCRALDMPPIMVGINEGALGANVEEQSLNFVRYTLQPWAKRVELAIRRDLIVADSDGKIRYKAEFNFSSLLRGNATARAAYFSAALGSGGSPAWMAVNEVRALDGLNRLDDPLFDKPALGTNPKQTPDNANTRGSEPSQASAEPARKGSTFEDKCAIIVAKELKLLRKYAERFASDMDGWRVAVSNFYRSHVAYVMKTLECTKDQARIYCLAREKRFLEANDILAAIDRLETNGVNELVKG